MKITTVKGKLETITGLHIGAGNNDIHIGGIDSEVIKDANGNPYIPGSSLKGKIRSLLEQSQNVIQRESSPQALLIKKMFGALDQNSITRLLFRDAPLSEDSKKELNEKSLLATEEKSENSINRQTGKAENPRNIERVIPGLNFDIEIVVRVFDEDDPEELKAQLVKGFALLEKDALGGSGSRGYGKVKFHNMTWDGEPFEVSLNK